MRSFPSGHAAISGSALMLMYIFTRGMMINSKKRNYRFLSVSLSYSLFIVLVLPLFRNNHHQCNLRLYICFANCKYRDNDNDNNNNINDNDNDNDINDNILFISSSITVISQMIQSQDFCWAV